MLLSVYMPHSGRDEEDYIEALETVRNIMTEGRRAGAVDFYIGGDINIELKLVNTGEDLRGLDSIEWNGMYGPECRGGGEHVISRQESAVVTVVTGVQLRSDQHLDKQRRRWRIAHLASLGISDSEEAT